LTLEVHLEGDVVIEEGAMAESMYFIASGELGISCKGYSPPTPTSSPSSAADDMYLKFVFEGCYVGEVALLLDSSKNPSAFAKGGTDISVARRTATLTVVSSTCVLYALKGTDLIHIIQEYPEVKLYMENAALGRYERMTGRKINEYEDQEDAKTAEYQKRTAAILEMEETLSPNSRRAFLGKGIRRSFKFNPATPSSQRKSSSPQNNSFELVSTPKGSGI
jgi:CRP-like cAMP-binding protein